MAENFTARYHGGPYIDLFADEFSEAPYDCINVWDYDRDEPTIEFTVLGVMQAIQGLGSDDGRLDPSNYE